MQMTPEQILNGRPERKNVKKQLTGEVVRGSGRLIFWKVISSLIFLLNSPILTEPVQNMYCKQHCFPTYT